MIKTIFFTSLFTLTSFSVFSQEQEDTIVGSHIRDFSVEELSLIEIIEREDMDFSGARTLGEYLRNSHLTPYNGRDSKRPNLRNADESRNTVLLNGRAIPRTGGTYGSKANNINIIPISAVDRIEVLSDGASAIYGSHASFMVINVITQDDVEGFQASIAPSYGSIDGGDSVNGSVTWGKTFTKGRFSTHLDVNYADEQYTKDKPYLNPDYLKNTRYSDNYITPQSSGMKAFPNCTEKKGRQCAQYHGDINRTGEEFQISSYSDLELDVENGMTVHADLLLHYDESSSYTPLDFGGLRFEGDEVPAEWNLTEVLAGDYQEGDYIYLYHRFPGEEKYSNERKGLILNLGLSGDFFDMDGWKWKANNNVGYYEDTSSYESTFLIDETKKAFMENRYNPFVGLGFDDIADDILDAGSYTRKYFMDVATFDVDGPLYKWKKAKLSMATGVEFGHRKYEDYSNAEAIRGNMVNLQGTEGSDTLNNQSVYLELGFDYDDWLKSQATTRADHFSVFETILSSKLALQVRPWKQFGFRASVGTGFNLPALPDARGGKELNAYMSVQDTPECNKYKDTDDEENKDKYCQKNWYPLALEPNPLNEETTRSWSVGMVAQPVSQATLSVDYWNHTIDGVINTPHLQHVLDLQANGENPNLEDYGITEIIRNEDNEPDIDQVTGKRYTNKGTEIKRGLDFKFKYDFHSRSNMNLKYSHILKDSYILDSVDSGTWTGRALGDYGMPRYRYSLHWDYTFPKSENRHKVRLERKTIGKYKNSSEDGDIPEHSRYNAYYRYRLDNGELFFKAINFLGDYPEYDQNQYREYFDTSLHARERLYTISYRLYLN